eukprot:PhM_4_TR15065/c0_g1_i1/m.500
MSDEQTRPPPLTPEEQEDVDIYLDMVRSCGPVVAIATRRCGSEVIVDDSSSSSGEEGDDADRQDCVYDDDVMSYMTSGASAEQYQVSRILNRKQRGGVVYYHVEWKFYPHTTWESGDVLRDEGQGLIVNEYEAKWRADHADRPSRKTKPKMPARRRPTQQTKPVDLSTLHDTPLPGPLCWTRWVSHAVQKFHAQSGVLATSIECVVQDHLLRCYLREYSDAVNVRLVYHGTRQGNIYSIINNGLYVPGTMGVRVENGSAHGVGIYLAESPSTSMSYTRGSQKMFVCAVILGVQHFHTTLRDCSIVVVTNPAQVLPLFLIHFETGVQRDANPSDTIDRRTLAVVKKFRSSASWKNDLVRFDEMAAGI